MSSKHLRQILQNAHNVIGGKMPATDIQPLTTGERPGVDYASKMPDEREFVASHSVEKHPDPNGNGPDVFSATNIDQTSSESGKHGHIPAPADTIAYDAANTSDKKESKKKKTVKEANVVDDQPKYGKGKKKLLLSYAADISEKEMSDDEKEKEEELKAKFDDSDMKKDMIKRYGGERGERIYFAYIRKYDRGRC